MGRREGGKSIKGRLGREGRKKGGRRYIRRQRHKGRKRKGDRGGKKGREGILSVPIILGTE